MKSITHILVRKETRGVEVLEVDGNEGESK
jgi:hypothetical protein